MTTFSRAILSFSFIFFVGCINSAFADINESFEGVFPPFGWQNTGSAGWTQSSVRAKTGSYSAFHDDIQGAQDAWLITPILSVIDGDKISFWQNQNNEQEYTYHGLWVCSSECTNPPTNWTEHCELGPGLGDTWEKMEIDLSAYEGDDIFLAFRYQGDWADEWYIDDVVFPVRSSFTVTPSAGDGGTINPDTPQTVDYGDTTAFTVTPDNGYTASVGGTCGGNLAGTTYTTNAITGACTVVASFTLNTYTVTPSAGDGGTVSDEGIYAHGSTVMVTATPSPGHVFVHWTEGSQIVSCNTNYSFRLMSDRTLRANFSQMQSQYTMTGSVNPANYATVTGAGFYAHGANVTMAALPNQGFALSNWIETWSGLAGYCVVSTNEQFTFPATRNRNLTANIRPKTLPGVLMLLLDE
jgi:hypothetical protein